MYAHISSKVELYTYGATEDDQKCHLRGFLMLAKFVSLPSKRGLCIKQN